MEIKYYEEKYLDSLNELLEDVFDIKKVYNNKSDGIELIAVSNQKVVGYLNLSKCTNLLTGENYFYVNYVCVHNEFRKQGIASLLFEKVFEISRDNNISYLELTSNCSRLPAHELYKKLGFVVRETTVFRKEFL